MGIRLDWEVESEAGWAEIGEDPAAIAARRRKRIRARNVIGVLIAVSTIVGGVFLWRTRQLNNQIRGDLDVVVAAETLALRIGDKDAFLNAQSDLAQWRTLQSIAYEGYQDLGERINVTGELINTDFGADKATVTLREELDGIAYDVLWFYEYRDEAGWLHVPPRTDYWGASQEKATTAADFVYHERDAALVELLSLRINGWWETGCRMTNCTDKPTRPEIRIEPDPLTRLRYAPYDDDTITIPSPAISRERADGSIEPDLLQGLAELLAVRWAEHTVAEQTGLPQSGEFSQATWLAGELEAWMRHAFDADAPPSAVLDSLTETYGQNAAEAFAIGAARIELDESPLPLLEEITETAAHDLAIGWETYLTHQLKAELHLLNSGFGTEAALLYRDPERIQPGVVLDIPVEAIAEPDSVEVMRTEWSGDVLWAEVEYSVAGIDEVVRSYEPFRIVEGRWTHSIPLEGDWGEYQEARSPHVILNYYDLDTDSIEGLLPYLEQTYSALGEDFGIAEADLPVINVVIRPPGSGLPGASLDEVSIPLTLIDSDGHGRFFVSSPYNVLRPDDASNADFVRNVAATTLVQHIVTGQIVFVEPNDPLLAALSAAQIARMGIDMRFMPEDVRWNIDASGPLLAPQSLEDVWRAHEVLNNPPNPADYIGARVLFELLVEEYGSDIVPVLIQDLPEATSMQDWLMRSIGVDAATLQFEWRTRMLEALGN